MGTETRQTGLLGLWAIVLGTLLFAPACTQSGRNAKSSANASTAGASAGARPLAAERFRFRAAVFHRGDSKVDAGKELRRLAETAGFAVQDAGAGVAPSGRTSVVVSEPLVSAFPAPDLDSLEYMASGLSDGEKRAVASSAFVVIFEFEGPSARASGDYRAALRVTRDLARALRGYVLDEESRNVFTVESFGPRVDGWTGDLPNVPRHVTLHLYRDGELMRVVSLGMVKFGLPDVAVRNVASSSADSMASVVNAVCQSLVEQGQLGRDGSLRLALDAIREPRAREGLMTDLKPNARRAVDVILLPAAPDEGDADNRLLELAFPGPPAALQERHQALLSMLFGSEDSLVEVAHDPEILAASERARSKIIAMRRRFKKGPPQGELLEVKVPFATDDGGEEWMWIEVVSWDGDTIHGILDNDPFRVSGLRAGARVDARQGDIFDYLWTKADGAKEGNETAALLTRKQRGTMQKKP